MYTVLQSEPQLEGAGGLFAAGGSLDMPPPPPPQAVIVSATQNVANRERVLPKRDNAFMGCSPSIGISSGNA